MTHRVNTGFIHPTSLRDTADESDPGRAIDERGMIGLRAGARGC